MSSWATNIYNTVAKEAALRKQVRERDTYQQPLELSRYVSSTLKFEIQYPKNWEITEAGSSVTFSSPLDSETDNYREGLTIQVGSPNPNLSLEQHANILINELGQNTQLYGTYLTTTGLAGYPAINFHCMLYYGSIPCEITTLFSIANGKFYMIDFHAYEYNRYLPVAEKMISTFRPT